MARRLPGPVTLVGSDTGGAIAQIAVVRAPELFDQLVLLPSDAVDNCPPKLLVLMRGLVGIPGVVGLLRWGFVRRAVMVLVARGGVPAERITEMLGRLPYDTGVRQGLPQAHARAAARCDQGGGGGAEPLPGAGARRVVTEGPPFPVRPRAQVGSVLRTRLGRRRGAFACFRLAWRTGLAHRVDRRVRRRW